MLSTHNRITKSRNTKRVPYNWCSGYLYLVFHLWKPLITWPLAFLEHMEHMEHRVFTTYDLASPRPYSRREPSARADATDRSRSTDLLCLTPPRRRSRSGRFYGSSLRGGPLHGLSDSRIPSSYNVSLGVRLYLVEQSRQLGYCHKAILQAVHC
jgi:hypothetical protein